MHKFHDTLASIVSDRGSTILSTFWKHLFKPVGTLLLYTLAYHPPNGWSTKQRNQCLEAYLRCMTSERPKQWPTRLPIAEWCYNTNYHSSIRITPFEALYGYKPPHPTMNEQFALADQASQHFVKHWLQVSALFKHNWSKAELKWNSMLTRTELNGNFLLVMGSTSAFSLTDKHICLFGVT